MRTITIDYLRKLGACETELHKLHKLFGDTIKPTRKLSLAYASVINWDWAARHLLPASALVEYIEVTASAQAEHTKVIASARAEHNKLTTSARHLLPASALVEYIEVTASAQAEHTKVIASARAEYNKVKAVTFYKLFKRED